MANTSIAAAAAASTARRGGPRWVAILDDFIRIPGTNIRFGIDGLLGLLLPGVGDAVTGAGAAALLTMALRERVPTVILLQMLGNIGLDVVLGLVPGLGDAFDFVWKANRRNLTLIQKYRRTGGKRPGLLDYFLVGIGLVLAALSALVPLVMVLLFWGWGQTLWHTVSHVLATGQLPS